MHLSFNSGEHAVVYIHCKRLEIPDGAKFSHAIDTGTDVYLMPIGNIDLRLMVDKSGHEGR
jgi:hypothetical protein